MTEAAVWLWTILLLMPLANFWCCCASPATPVCTRAICSNGGPIGSPTQYQVDISGFADGNCASNNCSRLDGSYTITIPAACSGNVNDSPGPDKYWNGAICIAADPTFDVSLQFNAGNIQVQVIIRNTSLGIQDIHTFRYSGSAVDCSSLSALNIPWLSDLSSGGPGAACDGSGATVTVTTV